MLRRTIASFGFLLRRFSRRSEGSVAVIFALAVVPIMIAVGAAIDYSRANSFKTSLQAALDAGLLAGSKDGGKNWAQIATDAFNANLDTTVGSAASANYTRVGPDAYSGSVSGLVPTAMLGIAHIPHIKVSVNAVANAADADNSCIITLDHGQPLSHVSLSLNGAPIVNVAGCSIRSNTALDCNGHDGKTKAIAAGTAAGCTQPYSSAPIVPDVYAPLASNITTRCGGLRPGATWEPGLLPYGVGLIIVAQESYTEYHICGDLTLSGSGSLLGESPTSDSVIIIENGSLTITNGSSISTSRTTIVMTGDNNRASNINFPTGNGQAAALMLSAATDPANPWRGVALYQDPKLTYKVSNNWGPGATFNADGLVYLGKSDVVTAGITGSGNAKCSKFVMNSFVTNGAVNLNTSQNSAGCTALGLKQWSGIIVHLTR